MDNPIFETIAAALSDATDLEELEARGTLRLALKHAGLEARSVTARQMQVVLSQVLPAELRVRGVEAADVACERLEKALDGLAGPATRPAEAPEDIFRRLAKR